MPWVHSKHLRSFLSSLGHRPSQSAKRHLRKLRIIQRSVEAAFLHKLVVIAGLADLAVLYNEYGIRVFDSGKAVRDNEAGAVLHQLCHSLLYFDLGARVYV